MFFWAVKWPDIICSYKKMTSELSEPVPESGGVFAAICGLPRRMLSGLCWSFWGEMEEPVLVPSSSEVAVSSELGEDLLPPWVVCVPRRAKNSKPSPRQTPEPSSILVDTAPPRVVPATRLPVRFTFQTKPAPVRISAAAKRRQREATYWENLFGEQKENTLSLKG